jgi:hypothetical protein
MLNGTTQKGIEFIYQPNVLLTMKKYSDLLKSLIIEWVHK